MLSQPCSTARLLAGFLAASFLAGCAAVGPDYREPEGVVPDAWSRRVSAELSSREPTIQSWWSFFDDATLDALIERARESNPDLKSALARIREARAARGVAASALYPFVDGSGAFVRSRASENLGLPSLGPNPSNQYTLGFDAGWEVDVFGGVRRSVESADAVIESEVENYRDALVSLFAEVALNYIDLRTLERRLEVAERNIEAQQGSVQITRNRLEAGIASDVDVSQAESNLAISEALIPALVGQIRATGNRLAILAGAFPGEIDDLVSRSRGIPSAGDRFGLGLPADLLRNRADIRRAERILAAQTAEIGVATADLYPRFGLGGNLSLVSNASGDLLESASRSWAFAPRFQWQLFNAGRVRSFIQVQEARTEQAYHAYEGTVLRAVEEVETSLSTLQQQRLRRAKLDVAVDKTEKTVRLTKDNYQQGLVSFQSVLDAERSLFNVQDEAVASAGQVSTALVALYKALGGGWNREDEKQAARAK